MIDEALIANMVGGFVGGLTAVVVIFVGALIWGKIEYIKSDKMWRNGNK